MLRSPTRPRLLATFERALALSLSLLGLTAVTGCSSSKDMNKWLPADAAVIRCTVAGPNLRLPPLFDEIPTPAVPTGMLARTMDPIALDELGYERDQPVCAALFAPDTGEIETAKSSIESFEELRRTVALSVKSMGRCRCTYADALDA
ncbi:MAG: hypothetical protein KC431_27600, partial [Myxococcales bacterium]|nr:hypothetical protein [Myxococcales bacterium]